MGQRLGDRLNARKIATVRKPESAEGRAWLLPDGKGLYLRIGPNGAKSWIFRYRRSGKRHDLGLGPLDLVSLAEARAKALGLRRELYQRQDPLLARQAARIEAKPKPAGRTFREIAEKYISTNEAAWRNEKHREQWRSTLSAYAYPRIGDRPIAEIGTEDVLAILEPIWNAKPETASRLRGRIEQVLDAAKAKGLRTGDNPAAWKGNLAAILPPSGKAKAAARRNNGRGEHFAALPYAELPGFMAALRAREGMAARAFEFAILTAARSGEVLGARWTEADLESRLWTVPAERMKGSREHKVPLSGAAIALLAALPREGDFLFPGANPRRPLSNMAMAMLLKRMGSGATVHGMRSTFSTWAAERTDYPREIIEASLAHASADKIEAAYKRTTFFEKRRALMEEWARFCAGN